MVPAAWAAGWGPPLVLALVVLVAAAASWRRARRSRGDGPCLPPGPRPWPLVGNLYQLDNEAPYNSYVEMSKVYGPVLTVYLGWSPTVVLVGYDAVREALVQQSQDFGFRPVVPVFQRMAMYEGITMAHGENFTTKKRFSLQVLKNFGFGNRSIEEKICIEVAFLIKNVASNNGQAFAIKDMLSSAVANNICSIAFGERFDDGDPNFLQLMMYLNSVTKLLGGLWPQLYNAFPSVLKRLPGPHNRLFEMKDKMLWHIQSIVDKHQTTWTPGQPRDYIDAFRDKQQKESGNSESPFNDKSLLACTVSLFMAGTETVYSTICWALLLMMHYPDTQSRVQEELDRVVGRDRMPRCDDRGSLPFTNAVIHETQRFANLLPYSFSHATPSDVTFRGYLIPKGTEVVPLLGSVLNDPSYWEKPDKFYPGHFLDKDGQFRQREAYMPFSAGRRLCLGESMAKTEVFIFVTHLLHSFTISSPEGCPAPGIKIPVSTFRLPPTYQMCAAKRTTLA